MLRIAVQSKGRLYEDSMALLAEAGIKLSSGKRTLLVPSRNFPVEILFLRDDDIPDSVASGVADVGIVGLNELLEKAKKTREVKRLGFSKCRLSLAIPKDAVYKGLEWFSGKKIATSYPGILSAFLNEKGIKADIHVITGSVEIAPGIGLADAIFDIVSSGSTLISNQLREVEVVVDSEAVLVANENLTPEKNEILEELVFRGILFGRLKDMLSKPFAVGISALIFAAVHANIVQFIYALILGVVLALLMDRAGNVYASMIGHMTANFIAVVRTETHWLDFCVRGDAVAWIFSLMMLGAGIVLMWKYLVKDKMKD